MGLYDTVVSRHGNISIQVKSTECTMQVYKIGDVIPLPNGVHVGYEGVFVVDRGLLLTVYDQLYDKWGGVLFPKEILDSRNPVKLAIDKIEDEHKDS